MAMFSFIRLHILPALFMFLVAVKPSAAAETTTKSTTTTGAGGNNAKENANVGIKSPRSEIVTYEKWNCGSGDFDKYLSHQLSMEECPKRMYEADLCCVVHDICYMDEKNSQQDCDVAFCHCLDRTVAQAARAINQSSATGCQTVSNSFCEIVKMFGGIAYATSKRLADRQKIAMEALEQIEAAAKKNGTNNGTSSSSTSTGTTTPSILSPSSSSAISSFSSSAIPLPISSTSTSPSSASSSIGSSSSSSSSSNAPSSTASPAEIGHFVTHKFPLNCFDDVLSECTKKLQQCTSRHFTAAADGNEVRGDALALTAQLAECSAQFCECTAVAQHDGEGKQQPQRQPARTESARWTLAKLAAQKEDECAKSLASICAQFSDIPMPPGAGNVNFWSINVNYIGQPISLAIAMIGSLLLMFALVAFGFLLFNLVMFVKRCLQMDESIRKNYAKSSIRRNTLTALRNVSGAANGDDDDAGERGGGGGPHYMPFGHGQKESTASSPSESEPAAQKLLGHGSAVHHHHHHNHHKKAHSDVMAANKNLLHSPHQHNTNNNNNNNMPLNSSQVHLIAGTGNSSSTLSDISSS